MGRAAIRAVGGQIGRLFGSGTLSGASESELLRRFAARNDEAAADLIVARHGPMVLGVCRRVLRDPSDVDDAYQATFLVLARRAGSIRDGEALGPWLFGVAHRVALRARANRARLRSRETGEVEAVASARDRGLDRIDLPEVLDREIQALPGPLRSAFVLCQLEGRTYDEAAGQLGWTEGMVRGRLARARDRLRDRLTRKGVMPAVPVLARLSELASATPPRLVAGLAAPSPKALELAQGVLTMIRFQRLALILAPTLALAAIGAAALATSATPPPPKQEPAPASDAKREPEATFPANDAAYTVAPPDILVVEVLETLPGRPIRGEHLVRPDGTISLGYYGNVFVTGLTLEQVKEKVVLHLRQYLTDEVLGLVKTSEDDKKTEIAPKDSDRVVVDVSSYNSKVYYVEGDFNTPGRLPCTGNERVLDAIHHAGGLAPGADPASLRLLRSERGKVRTIPVDYKQVTAGDDLSTNVQLRPGDRLVVSHRGNAGPSAASNPEIQALRQRVDEMDRKLDQILSAIKKSK